MEKLNNPDRQSRSTVSPITTHSIFKDDSVRIAIPSFKNNISNQGLDRTG